MMEKLNAAESKIDSIEKINLGGESPLMSVGIPAYSSFEISWLVLAGLSRQRDVPVPWEIVICQEDESISMGLIEEYKDILRLAGCVRVTVVQLREWVHLSSKWKMIGENLSSRSEIFLLQGVDDFPHPTRLASSWKAMQDSEIDWFHWKDMLFFDCNFETWSLFQGDKKPPLPVPKMGWEYHPCCPNMATRSSYLQYLDDEEVRRGVDGWFFYCIQKGLGRKPTIGVGDKDEQLAGFGTTGFNQLSLGRLKQGRSPRPPIFPYDASLAEKLEHDDFLKLTGLCDEARKRTLHILFDQLEVYESKIESLRAFVNRYGWVRKCAAPVILLARFRKRVFLKGSS